MISNKLFQPIVGHAYYDSYGRQCIAISSDSDMYLMMTIGKDKKQPSLFKLSRAIAAELKPIKRISVSKDLISLYHSLEITNEINEGDLLLFHSCFGIVIKNKRIIFFRGNDFDITTDGYNYMLSPNTPNIDRPFYKIINGDRKRILKASYKATRSKQYMLFGMGEDELEKTFKFEKEHYGFYDFRTLRKVLLYSFIKCHKQLEEEKRAKPRISLWHRIKKLLKHDGIVWTK